MRRGRFGARRFDPFAGFGGFDDLFDQMSRMASPRARVRAGSVGRDLPPEVADRAADRPGRRGGRPGRRGRAGRAHLSVGGRPLLLVAAEIEETSTEELIYRRLGGSVLAFTDLAAVEAVPWTPPRVGLVRIGG
jgi:hypothetical protein